MLAETQKRKIPVHVGLILDGNRRWARQLGYDSVAHGYRAGAAKIIEFLGWCDELGVKVVTLYLLSNDNLRKRDSAELADLIDIIAGLAGDLADSGDWRVQHAGRAELLPDNLATALEGQFWKRPYLLAELLVDIPCWPCGHSLEDLLFLCRVKLVQQRKHAGYIQYFMPYNFVFEPQTFFINNFIFPE